MERSTLGRWIVGLAIAVFLGFLAGRQQQMVDTQVEILRQLEELRTSPPSGQQAGSPGAIQEFDIEVGDAAVKGTAGAKLTLIEFSDFECPYCGSYVRESYPQIDRDYVSTGKIRYVFRHFPLTPLHPRAQKAGEAAECARREGKFWPLHDRLFANQKALDPASLVEHARAVGLDAKAFETCLNGEATSTVLADLDLGERIGVSATPTFLLGFTQKDGSVHVVERLIGAKPYQSIKSSLDRLLSTAP